MKSENRLVRFAVHRRVTMSMVVIGLVVLGWISLTRLPLEYLPSFSSSNISVQVPYRSSSPSEIERRILLPLEASLATINGIDMLSSSARADSGSINVTFVDGTDMDQAAVEVRDRVDRVRHRLPDDVEQVRIRRFQSTDIPVMRFHLSAPWPREALYRVAEEIVQRRIERLEGVAAVNVDGVRSPEIQVDLLPDRLQAHGVDVRDLATTLRNANVDMTIGDLEVGGRRWVVRADGKLASPAELARLPVNGDGLRLGDVARVEHTFPEQRDFNFLNGVEALTVSVNKNSTANLLATADRVRAELDRIASLPEAEGLAMHVYRDGSRDVRQGLGQLRQTGLFGGLLAMIAVYFFLRRFRTTLLVALAIPVSVVSTFVLLYLLRQGGLSEITLNVISLAGLMLALGMLVDNSVVVIESIFRHRNELGRSSIDAALHGTSEVALPITASTITTICVFLPLIFLNEGGRFKLYMENVGIMICIVIVASLLVALTVVPMVAAVVLRGQQPRDHRFSEWMVGTYRALLGRTLRHRFALVTMSLALLGGSAYLLLDIDRSFASRSLEREVRINIDTPRQYGLEQTRELYEELYDSIDSRRDELGIADITYSFDRGTGRSRGGWSRSRQFNVYLRDESESELGTIEVREKIRALLPTRAGVDLRIASSRVHGGTSGIKVELKGDDPAVLRLIANTIVERIAAVPQIRDVDSSLESGEEQIHVDVREERALQAGLSSQAVAMTVMNSLSSRALTRFESDDREVDVVMQFREEDRETLAQLETAPVFGDTVLPLGAVATFARSPGPKSVERVDGQSKIEVAANTADPRANFRVMSAVRETMDEMPLPAGYSWSFGRWNRHQQRDQNAGLLAMLLAAPLVYMVLAALFESFVQPFAIMFSVPFALIGVGIAMKLTGQPWDNMTWIGLIVLIGIVVNNAIVLIDHIDGLRRSGLPRDRAILDGGQHRLRPILITAVTTILGMAPMVAPIVFPGIFGPIEGRASTWAPIGLVIVGGLTTSTFLTLLITPTLYSLLDDLSRYFRRVSRAL